MEHVRLLADRALHNPVMLFAFTGWNDAGEAASAAVRTMVNHWGATLIADIDPEVFTDFATVRPSVYLSEGRRHIAWPTVQVWGASLPGADAILIVGPEPALQWRLFTQQIVALAEHFDVSMSISLGALLADVPHTHPAHVIGTSSEPELIDRFDLQRSTYEGPTGIVGVLQDAMAAADIAAASLWATVPGYTAQIPSPKACEALMRTACSMIGTAVPSGAFTRAIADYEARVAALVAEDPSLGQPLVAGTPYLRAEAAYAAAAEMATTVDDVLGHRTRARLLARDASAEAAPAVGALLGRILGWTPERESAEVAAYVDEIARERAALERTTASEADARTRSPGWTPGMRLPQRLAAN
jgi:proteasome assembly chaperone (PAC2) family protein